MLILVYLYIARKALYNKDYLLRLITINIHNNPKSL